MKKRLHLICNAHLDPVWQWQWQEGAGAALSTFRAAVAFCKETDGFVFCHSEALLYQWIEQYEPDLFCEIQELVKQGKWHIMGGWQLQPDCNLPCGEGFVRNIIAGRTYFAEKFGVKPTTAINFDPFGHTRGLVQILAKSGFDSYIVYRPDKKWLDLPADVFRWIGYDGSEVTVARSKEGYNSYLGKAAEKITGCVNRLVETEPNVDFCLWGVGNHGGGPSRKDLNDIAEQTEHWKEQGVSVFHSTPERFFADLHQTMKSLPQYCADLNPWAVGCYTTQIRVKQAYRRLESDLWMTEKMCAALNITTGEPYPKRELDEATYDLLFAQFHDILPGTQIRSAEEDTLQTICHGMEILSRIRAKAFFKLCAGQKAAKPGEIPILAYNPHPYPVEGDFVCEFMLADQNWKGTFTDATVYCGKTALPSQVEKEASNIPLDWRKRVVFHAVLPPMQMSRFDCRLTELPEKPNAPLLTTDENRLFYDDGNLQVSVNRKTGWIDSCRLNGTEYLQVGALSIDVYEDDEDPWGMRVVGWRKKIGTFTLLSEAEGSAYASLKKEIPSVRVIENGDVRTVIEAVFGYSASRAVVRYLISKQSHTMDLHFDLHNADTKKMYKLAIPFAAETATASGEVAFGEESVKSGGRENVIQRYVRMEDDKNVDRVLHIYNQGNYGCSLEENKLLISLMRSPAYTAHPIGERAILPINRQSAYTEQGERSFDFRLTFGKQPISDAIAAQTWSEEPTVLSFFPAGNTSERTKTEEVLRIDGDRVALIAFKKSEHSDDFIIRLFNPDSKQANCRIFSEVFGFDMHTCILPFAVETYAIHDSMRNPCNLMEEFEK